MRKWLFAALALAVAAPGCCSTPSYTPAFWNDGGTVQWGNNCSNYSNNVRTDTFAQPGRASGHTLTWSDLADCTVTASYAAADGIDPWPASGDCPGDWLFSHHTKLALVVAPNWDYHWYRLDANGMWTHKPGGTEATNLDNSDQPITNPETADRGPYTIFCGYFCSCSSATEGAGHEKIN
jgi:hypothetical protein